VVIYCYGGKTAPGWWDKVQNKTTRFDNLRVVNILDQDLSALGSLANRSMKMQVNIQDSDVMVSIDDNIIYVTPEEWKSAG
jgi:uncharacterized protein YaeQ